MTQAFEWSRAKAATLKRCPLLSHTSCTNSDTTLTPTIHPLNCFVSRSGKLTVLALVGKVYLELRNQDNKNGWKVGMNDDYKLHMGWGPVGTMNQLTEALRLDPDSNLHFFGEVEFKGDVVKEYSPSGLTCIGGNRITGGPNRWSSWSTCPSGYSVVGLQEISMHNSLDSNRGKYQDIDHHQCRNKGCRAWCRSDKCDVTARCCKTEVSPLRCYTGQYKTQQRYRWGRPAYCHRAYTVTGDQIIAYPT